VTGVERDRRSATAASDGQIGCGGQAGGDADNRTIRYGERGVQRGRTSVADDLQPVVPGKPEIRQHAVQAAAHPPIVARLMTPRPCRRLDARAFRLMIAQPDCGRTAAE
jgi:hypothetical protein